ncbi:MAG: SdrD B-like domain-containing protein [Candidatus Methanoperedens sp.]
MKITKLSIAVLVLIAGLLFYVPVTFAQATNQTISPATGPGSICGIKFNDLNGNGMQDAGEPGLPGWQINMTGSADLSVTTNGTGSYCFNNLKPGNYTIGEVNQNGWTQTAPSAGTYSFELTSGQNIMDQNFGNSRISPATSPGSICGIKFNDLNGNGVQDAGEPGLPGWQINIGGSADLSVTTDEKGNYCFNELKPGDYKIGEVNQNGWLQTAPSQGYYTVTLTSGQNIKDQNFGNKLDTCVNGKAWSPLGTGTNGEVWALAVIGTDLYAGGTFTTAGGVSANHIAKWNGTGWSALGSGINNGMDGSVFSLAVIGTDLYAGGWFTTAGGSPAENIAKWDGATWTPLGSGLVGSAAVEALAVSGTTLYAGGGFTTAGGVPAERIAKWDGTSWSALGSSGGMNDRVNSLTMIGTDLYAGGQFTTAGGVSANHIAKWDGTGWSPLGTGTNLRVGGSIGVMGGNLYPGGVFTTAGGLSANRVAKWDGTSWSALGSSGGMNDEVEGFAVMGPDLYASGGFTTAGGVSANRVAKWDGTSWSPLGTGMNDGVWRLAVIGQDLYAGGVFTTAGDLSANHVAKWGCVAASTVTPTATTTRTPPPTSTPTPTPTLKVPGFSLLVALVSLFIAVLIKRIK